MMNKDIFNMINRKQLLIMFIFVMFSISIVNSQTPIKRRLTFPKAGEYKVLKCEFHIHTLFSDGKVWPDQRVIEAYNDDLDAIALTEHLEYRPHNNYLKEKDHNKSYEFAKPIADELNVTLIKGTEITRMVPPGHLNAIFITDANEIFNPTNNPHPGDSIGFDKAVEIACSQGGFVFFNHPYYRQREGNIMIPVKVDSLMKVGLVKGIEIVNEDRYIPESFKWALEKNLTVIGTSDAHSSIDAFNREFNIDYRPITLVLAKERTPESIKEALFDRRTVVLWQNKLLGRKDHVESIYNSMVKIKGYEIKNNRLKLNLENNGPIPFVIEIINDNQSYHSQYLTLTPNSEAMMGINLLSDAKNRNQIKLKLRIKNLFVGDNDPLVVEYLFN